MIIGNKVAEKDIREFLNKHGYFGRSARFEELELHAIQRPGWLQVFRFCVQAKTIDDEWLTLYGAMKDDERFKMLEIELFDNINRRDHLLVSWSEGLMQPRFANGAIEQTGNLQYFRELFVFAAILGAILGVLALLGVR